MKSFFIALSVGGVRSRKLNDRPPRALRCRRCSSECDCLHRWGLGFRQSSFRPSTRVLRDGTFSVSQWLPLLWHAVVPSGFRLRVNQMTQEPSFEFLLIESEIQHRVPRHTGFTSPDLLQESTCIAIVASRFHVGRRLRILTFE